MSKYAPLGEFLSSQDTHPVRTTFNDLENALGFRLPEGAKRSAAWWANSFSTPQGSVWRTAGYVTREVDLVAGTVTFDLFSATRPSQRRLNPAWGTLSRRRAGTTPDSVPPPKAAGGNSSALQEGPEPTVEPEIPSATSSPNPEPPEIAQEPPRPSRTSKYAPIGEFLQKEGASQLSLGFAELETVLGFNLPASAHGHPAWWANSLTTPQGKCWVTAGFEVQELNLDSQRVTFVRKPNVSLAKAGTRGAKPRKPQSAASDRKKRRGPTRARVSKYAALTEFLRTKSAPFTPTLDELERVLDFDLPQSARSYASWWANTDATPQGRAWSAVGLAARIDSLEEGTVRFEQAAAPTKSASVDQAAPDTDSKPARTKGSRKSKYEAWIPFLSSKETPFTVGFDELEQALGLELPGSASGHRAWWANTPATPQGKLWGSLGLVTKSANIANRTVTFASENDTSSETPTASGTEAALADKPSARAARVSKYLPLAAFLRSREPPFTVTFDEVESALGFALPKSAVEYTAWWANTDASPHGKLWGSLDLATHGLQLQDRTVTFRRASEPTPSVATAAKTKSEPAQPRSVRTPRVGKYQPLAAFLQSKEAPFTATFDEIEGALGFELPKSATGHSAWWANTDANSQGRLWKSLGLATRRPQLEDRTVNFVRISGPSLDSLKGQASAAPARATRKSKYEPLSEFLMSQQVPITVSFEKIEDVLGFKLPNSAFTHSAWWANSDAKPQGRAWGKVGLAATRLRLGSREVTFARTDTTEDKPETSQDVVTTMSPPEPVVPVKRVSKYAPLGEFLKSRETPFRVSFDELEHVLGFKLPASARTHPSWWANTDVSPQAKFWGSIGLKARTPDLGARTISFDRTVAARRPASRAKAAGEDPKPAATPTKRKSKYEPLAEFLRQKSTPFTATFDEIEEALGFSLPKSAVRHLSWWANIDNSPQGRLWGDLGLIAKRPRIEARTVVFDTKEGTPDQVESAVDVSAPTPGTKPLEKTTTTKRVRTSKYVTLTKHLGTRKMPFECTFDELERIVGFDLPSSAKIHRAWWTSSSSSPQAKSWKAAGCMLADVDLDGRTLKFDVDTGKKTRGRRKKLQPSKPTVSDKAPPQARRKRRSKYAPLQNLLHSTRMPAEITFDQIESALDSPLPSSAHTYRSWWANSRAFPQSATWLDAGCTVSRVDFDTKVVAFTRTAPPVEPKKSTKAPAAPSTEDRDTKLPKRPKRAKVKPRVEVQASPDKQRTEPLERPSFYPRRPTAVQHLFGWLFKQNLD